MMQENCSPPDSVADMARRVMEQMEAYGLENKPERQLVALRLADDERMSAVWKRLLWPHAERHFLYPARIDALNPGSAGLEYVNEKTRILRQLGDANSIAETNWLSQRAKQLEADQKVAESLIQSLSPKQRQEWACGNFYLAAFWAAATGAAVFTAADVEEKAGHFQAMAAELREIGTAIRPLWEDGVSFDSEPAARELEKKARFLLARKAERLCVERHRGDDTVRAFVIRVEAAARHLFGVSLYGTVATVTNVALNRQDVTGHQVRELVRH
jgi:hypothetical protein